MRTIPSDALLPSDYQRLAARTEVNPVKLLQMTSVELVRLIHAGAGMVTEAGEFWDVLKRHIFYGQPLDRPHLAEEIGDGLWYYALACNALGLDMGEVMAANVRKLQARFPDKFTEELAKEENRDRQKEQSAAQPGQFFTYKDGEELTLDGDHPPEESVRPGAFSQLNDTLGAPAPSVGISFAGKVCEVCGKEATRAVTDRTHDAKREATHWFCYKHVRKAHPLDHSR